MTTMIKMVITMVMIMVMMMVIIVKVVIACDGDDDGVDGDEVMVIMMGMMMAIYSPSKCYVCL